MPSVEYTQSKGLHQKSSDNATLDLRGELQGLRYKLEDLASDRDITAAESGKVFLCANADHTVTLPRATTSGLWFRFILKADTASDFEIAVKDDADDFVGTVLSVGTNPETAADGNTIVKFAANTALAGDFIEVRSDGTDWFLSGSCQVDNAVAFA